MHHGSLLRSSNRLSVEVYLSFVSMWCCLHQNHAVSWLGCDLVIVNDAGLVVENWRVGRHKHMWVSIGSDLRIDTRRDLDDAGAQHIPVHPLNKLPYGTLASKKVGYFPSTGLLFFDLLFFFLHLWLFYLVVSACHGSWL